jgi:hypothetical protein
MVSSSTLGKDPKMTAALTLDSRSARDLQVALERLTGYAGIALINAAGWLGAAHILTWPGALITALLGVVLTTLLLPSHFHQERRGSRLGPPGGCLAA